MVRRRELIKAGGALTAGALVGATFGRPLIAGFSAAAQPMPRPPDLGPDEINYVWRNMAAADEYAAAYQQRYIVVPGLRALCRTARAVSEIVQWAREHELRFAVRSGGHCFEDFSQHADLVIDTRLLNRVALEAAGGTATVGAGALISHVHEGVTRYDQVVPVGTCLSVGMAGLTLGGGIGHLSRAFGLTCDALRAVEMIDADGRVIEASPDSHADLFWACRGGGGGSFGIATRFQFATTPLTEVVTFEAEWALSPPAAARFVAAWQAWTLSADHDFGTTLSIVRHLIPGTVLIRLQGWSVGSVTAVEREMAVLLDEARPWSPPQVTAMSVMEAADQAWTRESGTVGFHKTRSLVASAPVSADGLAEALSAMAAPEADPTTILLEALGGTVADVPPELTPFPHRGDQTVVVQIAGPFRPETEPGVAETAKDIYQGLRRDTSGASYVNYSDAELADWPRAYWQANTERLMAVKRRYDPANVFRHGQSVAVP